MTIPRALSRARSGADGRYSCGDVCAAVVGLTNARAVGRIRPALVGADRGAPLAERAGPRSDQLSYPLRGADRADHRRAAGAQRRGAARRGHGRHAGPPARPPADARQRDADHRRRTATRRARGGQPGDRRDAALAALDVLQDHLFLWRGPDGTITVSGLIVHEYLHMLGHEPSGLDDALSTAFNKETIALIGAHLGLGEPFLTRLELQEDIVTLLSQPTKVRRLLDDAPSAAGDLIREMVESDAALRTTVFYRDSQAWNAKYRIDPDDPARTGLAGSAGADRPDRTGSGGGGGRGGPGSGWCPLFAVSPRPPDLPAVDVPVARARGEAQVALVSAVTKLGQLLAGLDAAPVVPPAHRRVPGPRDAPSGEVHAGGRDRGDLLGRDRPRSRAHRTDRGAGRRRGLPDGGRRRLGGLGTDPRAPRRS